MPARQRCSSILRTDSRDANVSAVFSTRKMAQTGCDTSNAPRSLAALVAKYVCTYKVATIPKTTARTLPTNTEKKSSTRDRPRRKRYNPCSWNASGTSTAMNGVSEKYWRNGGVPLVTGISDRTGPA